MDSIEGSAEWKTYMLKKNRLNAKALLLVAASEILIDDKWKSRTILHQIAEQRYSLANDELKMGNIYYVTMRPPTSLVLLIYDIQEATLTKGKLFRYVYKWKNVRNGTIGTEEGSTRLGIGFGGEGKRSPTSNIFNSKRWVLVYPKSYQFINWTDNPFEVKS
tara:strand:+ start:3227 stop:3712 length:486 start_codon:yes stop_codon:yes gene_type:complete